MFDDQGHMRTTQKAPLKIELAVQRSHRCVTMAVPYYGWWPGLVPRMLLCMQDYIDAFREHVRRYQQEADVFLMFDRYVDGSTKEETRWGETRGRPRSSK